MPSAIDVRIAGKSDVESLAKVLGRAFADDPVMTWMLPGDHRRSRALARVFATLTRHHYLAGGAVEVATKDGAVAAAALWDPPGRWKMTPRQELRSLPGFLLSMGPHARRGMVLSELMKQNHPEEPHWYLGIIGSAPETRGAGLGQALMRSRLDRCDTEVAPAYLESTNETNVPYYLRFGFDVTGEITVPGGPTLWQMWRRPR